MEYLVKSILCLLLLLLFHRLVLQQEVLYRFNRFFLLGAVVGSFLIPLVILEVEQKPTPEMAASLIYPEVDQVYHTSESTESQIPLEMETIPTPHEVKIPWAELAWGIYGIGVLVFLYRFIRNIHVINDQIQKNLRITYRQETLVLLNDFVSPYSFLHYIFYPKSSFEKEGIPEAIFLHEQCHVKEKHSWDILFLEFLLIPFWFHPGLYLAIQAIRLNHEFIADQQVVKTMPIPDYQHLLISVLSGTKGYSLGSSLNFSLTKKRFSMMKKTSKPGIKILKLVSLVVFLGVIVALFAEKVAVSEPLENSHQATDSSITEQPKIISLNINESGEIFLGDEKMTTERLTQHLASFKGKELVVSLNAFAGTEMGEIADLQEMLKQNEVRRIYFQKDNGQSENTGTQTQRDRMYRNAIFLIESKEMDYTQKTYDQLSEKEKIGLLFPDKPVEKKRPNATIFESWKNKDEFALWIDGKSVDNSVLTKYQPEDFDWFFQSGVKANARSERFPQPFQVYLYSPQYFEESFGPDSEMFRPRTNRDTITITQRNMTSMKDLSRYPDPTTAYLQKNAYYEKLRTSRNIYANKTSEEKALLRKLYEELKLYYDQATDAKRKQLKEPILPDSDRKRFDYSSEGSSEKITSVSNPINRGIERSYSFVYASGGMPLDEYLVRYGQFQTKVNENRLFTMPSNTEIEALRKEFDALQASFLKLSLEERKKVRRASFPYARIEKEGLVIYKKFEDLTEEERATMTGC
ncbi:M56 family metallopeptidase [Algoriphagus mannitolivorans]|uniref:M56 family metallopeptidase n=1 Tax=Algoriphagus mannitolivorans TaxID=226504 RepID=UPI00041706F2|nr:M56 family metallopeptidase [Algoriphagus mannitolivorans]